ncbi:MAG TPA: hypothetical protein VJ824_17340 [Bacillota bacterium]|nr:hypothetical protein [Bacillota bacterium]
MSSRVNNIIPFQINAGFFNNIAAKSLERYNYTKALRFFKRAVDIEPNNPHHFFNMAGVLARVGKFEESNEFLHRVLEELEIQPPECHYYLACNYTSLDQLEAAEKHALAYIEQSPMGTYAKEVTELLDYLGTGLNYPPDMREMPEDGEEQDEKTLLHDQARELLEKGSFQQAEKMLVDLIRDYPDFLAAINNLSLCYYYKGEFEKSHETVMSVLSIDPSNIHALCNLAVLYYQFQDEESLTELLSGLKKVVPLQYDQAYKLGITLGVMGEHEAAYRIFKQMAVYAWQFDFQLFHYCAVAAYNLGMYKEAGKYWRMVQREDPRSPVARFYLDQLRSEQEKPKEVPYYYQLPVEQQRLKNHQKGGMGLVQEIEKDPFIRSSFLWALRYGDRETKLQVLQAFEWLGDHEVVEALLEFVERPDQDEELKKIATFVLKTLGHSVSNQRSAKPRSKSWMKVLQLIETFITSHQQEKARRIWTHFIETQESIPVIRKPEAWVASIEWILNPDQELQPIADKYGVSLKTIMKHAETLRGLI